MSNKFMQSTSSYISPLDLNAIASVDEPVEQDVESQIIEIPLTELTPYYNKTFDRHQPFTIDDNKLDEMVESIKGCGKVLSPILVRPCEDGGFEILAGHTRVKAAEKAGFNTVPAIVRTYTDEEATTIMVDTNIQRENIPISEKAWAYRMKMEAMKKQGKRNSDGKKVDTASEIGSAQGESGKTVQRIIRISYLVDDLLPLVDTKKLNFVVGVAISFLSESTQQLIFNEYTKSANLPTDSQVKELRQKEADGTVTEEDIRALYQTEKIVKPKVVLNDRKLYEYFPATATQSEMEEVILNLLEEWSKNQ